MASIGSLLVSVGADIAGFESAMGTVGQRLAGVAKDAVKAGADFEKFGKKLSDIGLKLSVAITAPLAAIAAVSIKSFGDFDSAMTRSLAIMGDVSKEMREKMARAASDVAKVTTFSGTEAAKAYYYLASAGLKATESIETLPVVAKFAQAGLFDMARATEVLADAQTALGMRIRDDAIKNMENMVRVSDVLVRATSMSNATTEQFAEALTNKAAAALRIVGKEVEEGVAVLAAFADQGVKGAEAGERLNIVMRDLQRAAIAQKGRFKELGVAVYDSSGNMRNMGDIMADLEKALAGMSDEQRKTTLQMMDFQERSVSALLTIIGTSKSIKDYEAILRKAGGTTDQVANKQMQTFNAQMILLKHQIEGVAKEIGKTLVPMLLDAVEQIKPVIGRLQDIAHAFAQLPKEAKLAITATIATIAMLPPSVLILGKFAEAIGMVRKAIVLFAGTIVTISAATKAWAVATIAAKGMAAANVELAAAQTIYTESTIGYGTASAAAAAGATKMSSALVILKAAGLSLLNALKGLAAAMLGLPGLLAGIAAAGYLIVKSFLEVKDVLHETVKGVSSLEQTTRGMVVVRYVELLAVVLRQAGTSLGELSEQLKRGVIDSVEYEWALRRLAGPALSELYGKLKLGEIGVREFEREAQSLIPTFAKVTTAAKDTGKPVVDLAAHFKDLEEAAKKAEFQYKAIAAAYAAGRATMDQVSAAHERLRVAQERADPTKLIERQGKATEEMVKRYEEAGTEILDLIKDLNKLGVAVNVDWRAPLEDIKAYLTVLKEGTEITRELEASQRELAATMDKALQGIRERAIVPIEIDVEKAKREYNALMDLFTKTGEGFDRLLAAAAKLNAMEPPGLRQAMKAADAYRQLGLTSTSELQRVADANKKAYEEIARQVGPASNDALAAWVIWQESELKVVERKGGKVKKSYRDMLENIKQQVGLSAREIITLWDRVMDAFTVGVLRQGQRLTDWIFSGFRMGQNKQLREEERELRASLEKRRAEWDSYQRDVAVKIEKLRADYEKAIADAEAQTAEKLGKAAAEWGAYQREVADKISEGQRKHAEAMAKELGDLQKSLQEREDEYADYVRESARSLAKLRADAAREAIRASEDAAEAMSDAQRDYARTVEDIQRQIAEAAAAGDMKRVAELQIALKRASEDFAEYQSDTQKTLQRTLEDNRRVLAEQEAAAEEEMAKRQKELAEERDSLAKQMSEIRAQHAKEMAEEEAELLASLAQREQEYIEYKRDVLAELEDLKQQEAQKLAEGTAALETELAERAAEWAEYQAEVAKRLQEIHDTFLTIGRAIMNVLKEIARVIVDVLIEQGLVKLLRWLGIIKDGTSGLVEKMGELVGMMKETKEIAGVLETGMEAGGVPAGAAPGTTVKGAGFTGWLGAISAAVSAVTDVLGYFQTRRMEQDIGRLEVTSREIKAIGLDQLASFREFLPYLPSMNECLWRFLPYLPFIHEAIGSGSKMTGEQIAESIEAQTVGTQQVNMAVRNFTNAYTDATADMTDALHETAASVEETGKRIIIGLEGSWGPELGVTGAKGAWEQFRAYNLELQRRQLEAEAAFSEALARGTTGMPVIGPVDQQTMLQRLTQIGNQRWAESIAAEGALNAAIARGTVGTPAMQMLSAPGGWSGWSGNLTVFPETPEQTAVSGGVTINIIEPTFRDRSDVDYMLDRMVERLNTRGVRI